MRADREDERIDTTMGELIAALTEAAFEIYEDKATSYVLAGLALEEILKKPICGQLAPKRAHLVTNQFISILTDR